MMGKRPGLRFICYRTIFPSTGVTMRQMMLGLCLFAAACSNPTGSPTAPSSVLGATGAQVQANGGANVVEVTFTKWIDPSFPNFAGVSLVRLPDGGQVPGTFAATVLDREELANGNIIDLRARYEVIADDPARSFKVLIEGKQNNQTRSAVLNGTVVEGWLMGARVHVTFDVIEPCPAFQKSRCFSGTIRVLAGSGN
jgi:hypothetical protein